ncbi:DUF4397 domain-containing protein [Sutcliffiella horikoshii]|uniref:DUF4397 domain-containing protein n=1 Tax=Sutcliffiella horikoshii TaxID=79883 RepID=UPI001F357813|nr:DUF4397 domain-containing protein [Sutcliffiella horikoshii]MCG1021071.1 DUF4397 domain-containing protein [Sutcliffiella horikoshii]
MSNEEHYYRAAQYQLLADYFKYLDPEKHIHFYKMHYIHLHKWLHNEPNLKAEKRTTESYAKIRFIHASPEAPSLDVYIDNEVVSRDLRYKNSSVYVDTKQLDIQISAYSSGSTESPLITGVIQVKPDISYTLAIAGSVDNLQLIMIEDDPSVPQSEAKMRFWHLSPSAPAVDIAVKKGDVVFSDISFTELSEYLGLTPMTVDLEVRIAGTKEVVLPLNRVSLKPDLAYTIIAIGSNGIETIFLVP